jgi:hypothetical protein
MIKQTFQTIIQTLIRKLILTKNILIISNHTYYLMETKIILLKLNNGKYIKYNLNDYYFISILNLVLKFFL